MKYLHRMVIAYQFNHNGTLVLHINFKDNNSTQYTPTELINVALSNEIPEQEIWGTYYQLWGNYQHGTFIFPIFYCKKALGEAKMLLKGQSAATGQEYFELDGWNINDQVVSYTSTVEEV